jgi:acetyl-CoA C-acetyltransferase
VNVFITGAARTATGRFGGALKDVIPQQLAAVAMRAALDRSGLEPGRLDDVIMGSVLQTNDAPNVARVAALLAGVPETVPAYTVHRQCGSGLQSVLTAAQAIASGDARVILAGGVENMTRSPYYTNDLRFGARAGHVTFYDPFVRNAESCAPTELYGQWNMGMTAENLAEKYGISRAEQDAFALASQRKGSAAVAAGLFREEIAPVAVPEGKGKPPLPFETDETPRADSTAESLARLSPAFKKDGTVTAGNSCPLSDGAAAVVVMAESVVRETGAVPWGRLVAHAVTGVDPRVMGIGPAPACRLALERAGLTMDQMDLIELNEAFAAQSLAVLKELDLVGDARVNADGGAIALGHPVGATGAKLLVTLLHALRRRGARYGLVTLCIGGGMGIAAIVEAV